ncbi:hypothetical protein AB0D04_36060 [Streptomyces sp. NPDC048483]|uniref:hypothetical protein n=1 Tax=Streptomyces sp. NPDC048483 TaxID=3154927 RepID=UPI0034224DB1
MTHNRLSDLVAAGFIDRLTPRDKALLERRVRIKSAGTEPFPLYPRGWWYAVPGATYEGLFSALDLHDRFPVTLFEGTYVEDRPWRGSALPVFITPELDGWRLIYGNLESAIDDDWDAFMGAVERLSVHCGQAQMFYEDTAGGSDIWVVAENGRIRRRFAAESDPEWEGDPLPWEVLRADEEDFDPEYDEAEPNEGTVRAAEACGRLSVDPTAIGPATRMRGHGWLALCAADTGHEQLDMLVR